MPMDVLQLYLLAALYLQKWNVSEFVFIPFGIFGVIMVFILGHILYQKGFVGRANSIQTEISNPQVMEILETVKRLEEALSKEEGSKNQKLIYMEKLDYELAKELQRKGFPQGYTGEVIKDIQDGSRTSLPYYPTHS